MGAVILLAVNALTDFAPRLKALLSFLGKFSHRLDLPAPETTLVLDSECRHRKLQRE